jgi:hypothetical protein
LPIWPVLQPMTKGDLSLCRMLIFFSWRPPLLVA